MSGETAAMIPGAALVIRRVSIGDILPLRHAELRAGMALDCARFEGDEVPSTFHFGAFVESGENIGCASFMLSVWEDERAYQLRGMATRRDLTGRGIGGRLLRFAEDALRVDGPAPWLWCNARVPAIGFYERQGWKVASDVFEIPTAGPHRRMMKRL